MFPARSFHTVSHLTTLFYRSFRDCEEVVYVHKIAKGVRSRSAFRKLGSKARQTIEDLNSTNDKKLENKRNLRSIQEGIVASIKDVRRKLKETLDRIERNTLKEVDVLILAMEQDLQSSIDTCSNLRGQVQRHLHDMDCHGEQCDNFAFAVSKLCEMKLSDAEDFMTSLPEEDFEVQFIPDEKAKQYFAQRQCLGTFLTTPYVFYTVAGTEAVNVRQDADKKCGISGLCQLPDGYIVVVDPMNTEIKLWHPSSYSVVAQTKLPDAPQDICHTKGSEVVVTVCEKGDNGWVRHELHFLDANNGSLLHKRTVRLANPCIGIVHHKGQLYISSETSLYLYTTAGKLLKELYRGSKPTIYRFSVSDDSQLIYITQFWENLLFSLDITDHSVSTISENVETPTGVCTSGHGTLFVCDQKTNTVHQLDLDGNRVSTLATSKDGIKNPTSLWYNRRTRQLFVGQEDDHLLVLKLK